MTEELKQIIDLYNYTQGILACLIIIAITNAITFIMALANFFENFCNRTDKE